MNLNYQLGLYVAGYIVSNHLPTLSTDSLKTRNIINVSPEETAIWEEMDAKWYDLAMNDSDIESATKMFNENRKWYKQLEEKYLKDTLRVPVPRVIPSNMRQFSKGIKEGLWDSHLSHYWIEKDFFEQTDEYAWCSYIILTKSK